MNHVGQLAMDRIVLGEKMLLVANRDTLPQIVVDFEPSVVNDR